MSTLPCAVPARHLHPRRLDTVETVGKALLAATDGLGHRRIAELVERPTTTVREWLRRARANSEAVRADATVAFSQLDANHGFLLPTGTELGDALDALGSATAAWARRHGSSWPPWRLAAHLTRTALLVVRPEPNWHGVT